MVIFISCLTVCFYIKSKHLYISLYTSNLCINKFDINGNQFSELLSFKIYLWFIDQSLPCLYFILGNYYGYKDCKIEESWTIIKCSKKYFYAFKIKIQCIVCWKNVLVCTLSVFATQWRSFRFLSLKKKYSVVKRKNFLGSLCLTHRELVQRGSCLVQMILLCICGNQRRRRNQSPGWQGTSNSSTMSAFLQIPGSLQVPPSISLLNCGTEKTESKQKIC